jgi:hypothetical protein
LTPQTTPFKKEPAPASGKTIRGVLNFGGGNSMPFLWQPDAGKLCLDLNRNQDLTDDPDGVFTAPASKSAFSYQTFTNVRLSFNTASGKFRVLADILLYDYGSEQGCGIETRSFWQGKLTLQGRDWQAGIVPFSLFSAPGSFENSRLLLRPWEQRNQPFSATDGLLATVPLSRKLFLDGRAWQVQCPARSQDGEAIPSLQFTEQSAALGELKITGRFIQRMVLTVKPSKVESSKVEPYLVVLDQPAASVQIPVGDYNPPEIALEQGGAAAYNYSLSQEGRPISVDGKTPAVLNAGGPLTNSITASRQGQDLVLDYILLGAGGAAYKMATNGMTQPPSFAIYKGEKKIESGDFEFG